VKVQKSAEIFPSKRVFLVKELECNTLFRLQKSAEKLDGQIPGSQLENIGKRRPTHSFPNSSKVSIHTRLFEQFVIEATGVVEDSVFQHVVGLILAVPLDDEVGIVGRPSL